MIHLEEAISRGSKTGVHKLKNLEDITFLEMKTALSSITGKFFSEVPDEERSIYLDIFYSPGYVEEKTKLVSNFIKDRNEWFCIEDRTYNFPSIVLVDRFPKGKTARIYLIRFNGEKGGIRYVNCTDIPGKYLKTFSGDYTSSVLTEIEEMF